VGFFVSVISKPCLSGILAEGVREMRAWAQRQNTPFNISHAIYFSTKIGMFSRVQEFDKRDWRIYGIRDTITQYFGLIILLLDQEISTVDKLPTISYLKGGDPVIEIAMYFELLPGKDQKAYAELSKAVVAMALEATGVVEVRGHRNMLGAPQVRFTTVWERLVDWATFNESKEWQEAWAEMTPFLTNLRLEIWGPSPIVPEPLRPGQ